jgi:ankyrin repeat protein
MVQIIIANLHGPDKMVSVAKR